MSGNAAITKDLRSMALDWYRRNRARSRELFDLLTDEAYHSQPIALRHPIIFYEGHLPGFSFNTLVKKALACPSIDSRLEEIFARGIDPHEYIRDVLTRLPNMTNHQIPDITPAKWAEEKHSQKRLAS